MQTLVGSENAKIGMGPCMKNKWVKKSGDLIVRAAEPSDVVDSTRQQLITIIEGGENALTEEDYKNLKRRKLVQQVVRKSARVTKGSNYRPKRVKKYADLTKDMLGNKAEVRHNIILAKRDQ